MESDVVILGVFVADTAYLAPQLPVIGQTLLGSGFALGPGGKGSNQAVAAAMAGAKTTFISKIGRDAFGEIALRTYEKAGVRARIVQMDDVPTGAAFIYVSSETGDNAIIVYPGAAGTISRADVEDARDAIESSRVFVTQLEQPVEAAETALRIARDAGVVTIFNPAPAEIFPDTIYSLCDYIVPNETEAAALVGFELLSIEDVRRAGDIFLERGAKSALITLGGRGVFFHSAQSSTHIPVVSNGPAIDTTGAGDAFVGGFAAALSNGMETIQAVRFGCATAGIAVTRRGTAPAMPDLGEIEELLAKSDVAPMLLGIGP
ncbi:ribokinase [Rhizobium sp. A37_96]